MTAYSHINSLTLDWCEAMLYVSCVFQTIYLIGVDGVRESFLYDEMR